jgi:hypothetical protein
LLKSMEKENNMEINKNIPMYMKLWWAATGWLFRLLQLKERIYAQLQF